MNYEVKIRYEKMFENGVNKTVTDSYLLTDCLSFSEAEQRAAEALLPYHGDLSVVAIKRSQITEIVHGDALVAEADAEVRRLLGQNKNATSELKWFTAKVAYITIDERTAREKRQPYMYLVEGASVNNAHDILCAHMKGTMGDYEIIGIDESKIVDIIAYKAG